MNFDLQLKTHIGRFTRQDESFSPVKNYQIERHRGRSFQLFKHDKHRIVAHLVLLRSVSNMATSMTNSMILPSEQVANVQHSFIAHEHANTAKACTRFDA